jgi:hypothetical protein
MPNIRHDTNGEFRVEVIADRSGKWCGNAVSFDTADDAECYALALLDRWTAVERWRVVNSTGSVEREGH